MRLKEVQEETERLKVEISELDIIVESMEFMHENIVLEIDDGSAEVLEADNSPNEDEGEGNKRAKRGVGLKLIREELDKGNVWKTSDQWADFLEPYGVKPTSIRSMISPPLSAAF